mgnify:CR=1 FL=1
MPNPSPIHGRGAQSGLVPQRFGKDNKPRLLDQVRSQLRLRHYSYRTEQQYVAWIKRFILYHGKRHPASMGAPELEGFLSYLAVERKVAAATQCQALAAVLFLYKQIGRAHV